MLIHLGRGVSVQGESLISLTDLQREFYKIMLSERKTKILDYSYQKLLKRERSKKRKERDER